MDDDKLSSAANSDTPAKEEDKIVEVKSEEIKPAEWKFIGNSGSLILQMPRGSKHGNIELVF